MTVQLSFDTGGRTTHVVTRYGPEPGKPPGLLSWSAEVELDTGDQTFLYPIPGRYATEQQAHQAAAGYVDALMAAKAS